MVGAIERTTQWSMRASEFNVRNVEVVGSSPITSTKLRMILN